MKTEPLDIWGEYQNGLTYQGSMGFSQRWPELVNFVEGKQWPSATEKTKYMPRPVINICDFIVENKTSNILSSNLKLIFTPEEIPEEEYREELTSNASDMTDMAQNTWNDINQDGLNADVVYDVLTLGTGIFHYYYDNTLKGGQFTKYIGGLMGEVIDPMDIVLGNPHLRSNQVQRQPYIIIRTREDLEAVKEKYGNKDLQADNREDEKYENAQQDMTKPNKVTCLTKYYKEKGQVYWTKVTKEAVLIKPRPLAPKDSPKPFELFPVEIITFKDRKKCTFGRSVIEDILPNQKALNWGIGMMLLSIQLTAWPKIIAKADALKQAITNEPGEILTDNSSMPGVDGIKYMQPPNFSTMPVALSEKLLDMTRMVTGVTEVTTGEVIGANMAAAAIIALQNQAKKPTEAFQYRLYRGIKNIGRIWEEFYKTYYNMPRPIEAEDEDGQDVTKIFEGTKYHEMGFGLAVDVGPASVYNESLQVSILDKMYDKGDLSKFEYVKYMPKNTIPAELRQNFEKEEKQIEEQQEMMEEQQGMPPNMSQDILSELTPDEQEYLMNNPEILDSLGG